MWNLSTSSKKVVYLSTLEIRLATNFGQQNAAEIKACLLDTKRTWVLLLALLDPSLIQENKVGCSAGLKSQTRDILPDVTLDWGSWITHRLRSALGVHWKDWCWSWNSSTLATSCEELTHWKRPWCWEGLVAGEEGDDRGWDGWMASQTRWAWVWVDSGSWWWTGRPGMLRFMGSQRVGHDWATGLNWTDPPPDCRSTS